MFVAAVVVEQASCDPLDGQPSDHPDRPGPRGRRHALPRQAGHEPLPLPGAQSHRGRLVVRPGQAALVQHRDDGRAPDRSAGWAPAQDPGCGQRPIPHQAFGRRRCGRSAALPRQARRPAWPWPGRLAAHPAAPARGPLGYCNSLSGEPPSLRPRARPVARDLLRPACEGLGRRFPCSACRQGRAGRRHSAQHLEGHRSEPQRRCRPAQPHPCLQAMRARGDGPVDTIGAAAAQLASVE